MNISTYMNWFAGQATNLACLQHTPELPRFQFIHGDETVEETKNLLDLNNPCLILFPYIEKMAYNSDDDRRMQYFGAFGIIKACNASDRSEIVSTIDEARIIAIKIMAALKADSDNVLDAIFPFIDYNAFEVEPSKFTDQGHYGIHVIFAWEEPFESALVLNPNDYI